MSTKLEESFDINKSMHITNIVSGTGILNKLFLNNGYEVIIVKTEDEMR